MQVFTLIYGNTPFSRFSQKIRKAALEGIEILEKKFGCSFVKACRLSPEKFSALSDKDRQNCKQAGRKKASPEKL